MSRQKHPVWLTLEAYNALKAYCVGKSITQVDTLSDLILTHLGKDSQNTPKDVPNRKSFGGVWLI